MSIRRRRLVFCARVTPGSIYHERRSGALIMAGAVATIIDYLKVSGGLKGSDVANITTVSPATVSRWSSGKALPHPKMQLLISNLVTVSFGDTQGED